eukprot:582134-Pleurochrysis_carterae.AAC.2
MSARSSRLLPRSTRSTLSANRHASSMRTSAVSYPAHLATQTQKELQRPSYKVGCNPFFPLTVKAFDELWLLAFRNGMIRQQAEIHALSVTQEGCILPLDESLSGGS